MYEAYYHLHARPFSILPDPDFMYWGENHQLAFAMLKYGSWNHMGFTVITGDVGAGKTTLVNQLVNTIEGDITVGLVSNTREDGGELLNWVLMAFDQPLADLSYPLLFQQFKTFILEEHRKGRQVILIIDEAQNLDLRTLEELRLLFNINSGKEQILQLILVGQPELKDKLQRPELKQFAQRVSSDFHLKPLPKHEVIEYIDHRLSVAGSTTALFSEEACDLIALESGGVPRVINILCDTSLVYAFSTGAPYVMADMVRKVIADKAEYGVFSDQVPQTGRERLRSV